VERDSVTTTDPVVSVNRDHGRFEGRRAPADPPARSTAHARLADAPARHTPEGVSERLGHGSTAFTMDVYAHTTPGLHAEAAESVAALLAATT